MLKEQFTKLDKATKQNGRRINVDKTKYIASIRPQRRVKIGQNVTLERVQQFKYLKTDLSGDQ